MDLEPKLTYYNNKNQFLIFINGYGNEKLMVKFRDDYCYWLYKKYSHELQNELSNQFHASLGENDQILFSAKTKFFSTSLIKNILERGKFNPEIAYTKLLAYASNYLVTLNFDKNKNFNDFLNLPQIEGNKLYPFSLFWLHGELLKQRYYHQLNNLIKSTKNQSSINSVTIEKEFINDKLIEAQWINTVYLNKGYIETRMPKGFEEYNEFLISRCEILEVNFKIEEDNLEGVDIFSKLTQEEMVLVVRFIDELFDFSNNNVKAFLLSLITQKGFYEFNSNFGIPIHNLGTSHSRTKVLRFLETVKGDQDFQNFRIKLYDHFIKEKGNYKPKLKKK